MLELITQPEAVAFTAALVLMVAVGVLEALGLGASGFDVDVDADTGLLDWLGVGDLPLSIILISFLAIFGALGLSIQQVCLVLTDALLPVYIAVPGVLLVAVPLVSLASRMLARVVPRDETTALDLDDLVGRAGTITIGRASKDSPARTRVLDLHGQAHHVLVEPNDPTTVLEEGDVVLLVSREGGHFRAILHASPRFSDWTIS